VDFQIESAERNGAKENQMLPPKLILSPIDFSDPSHEALNTATALATEFHAELLLVHVVPMLPKLPSEVSVLHEGEFEQQLQQDAEKQLKSLAEKLAKKNIKARVSIGLPANDTAMEILRIAEHEHADLIVIATHGMTGWKRLVFGSVTEKVVRLADCPVLVLRAYPAGEGEKPAAKQSTAAVSH
jgi:nucleotide-binding universal stress UspA family protein